MDRLRILIDRTGIFLNSYTGTYYYYTDLWKTMNDPFKQKIKSCYMLIIEARGAGGHLKRRR